jgi:hypothetical protein
MNLHSNPLHRVASSTAAENMRTLKDDGEPAAGAAASPASRHTSGDATHLFARPDQLAQRRTTPANRS